MKLPEPQCQQTPTGKTIFKKIGELLQERDLLFEESIMPLETLAHSLGIWVEMQFKYESDGMKCQLDDSDIQELEEYVEFVPFLTIYDLQFLGLVDIDRMQVVDIRKLFPEQDEFETYFNQ